MARCPTGRRRARHVSRGRRRGAGATERSAAVGVSCRPPNWLGDAVLALPAMAAIRRHFASAPPDDRGRAVGRGAVPRGHRRRPGSRDRAAARATATRRRRSRAAASTSASCFPNSFRSAWQFWRAGIPRAMGVSRRRAAGWLLTRAASRRARRRRASGRLLPRRSSRGLGIECDDSRAAPGVRAGGAERAQRATALLAQRGIDARRAARWPSRRARPTARPSSGRRIGWRRVVARLVARSRRRRA